MFPTLFARAVRGAVRCGAVIGDRCGGLWRAAQQVSFDAKRDRWLGYHPDEHKHTIDRFNKIDQERRRARREEAEKQEDRRKVGRAGAGLAGLASSICRREEREVGRGQDTRQAEFDGTGRQRKEYSRMLTCTAAVVCDGGRSGADGTRRMGSRRMGRRFAAISWRSLNVLNYGRDIGWET